MVVHGCSYPYTALGHVTITDSGTTPTAGSPYTLTCTVPVIGWNGTLTIQLTAPNGSVLTRNMVSASPEMNYTLQWPFSPLHTSDGGQYSCVANGLTISSNSSYTLAVSGQGLRGVRCIERPVLGGYNKVYREASAGWL